MPQIFTDQNHPERNVQGQDRGVDPRVHMQGEGTGPSDATDQGPGTETGPAADGPGHGPGIGPGGVTKKVTGRETTTEREREASLLSKIGRLVVSLNLDHFDVNQEDKIQTERVPRSRVSKKGTLKALYV